jgi:two-component sensor histidine kinase
MTIGSNKALLLAMALHELSTNAVKYGALSNSEGVVEVSWSLGEGGHMRLDWRERGGPPVKPPAHAGFGSRMIERALTAEGGVSHFNFAPTGLEASFEMPL